MNEQISKTLKKLAAVTLTASMMFGTVPSPYRYEIEANPDADASEVVAINSENFPDEVFRNYIKGNDLDGDGYFSNDEIKNIKTIYVAGKNLKSLEGIQYFTSTTVLNCGNSSLTELDVTALTQLESLYCDNNEITKLNVSGLKNLKSLSCNHNDISELDVKGLENLTSLRCSENNISVLDLVNLKSLDSVSCANNNINFINVNKLNYLYCAQNPLYAVNASESVNRVDYDQNSYHYVNSDTGMEDLPGLKPELMSNITGGTISGNKIIFEDNVIKYDYDIGNGKTSEFRLALLDGQKGSIAWQIEGSDLTITGTGDITGELDYLVSYDFQSITIGDGINTVSRDCPLSCEKLIIQSTCTDAGILPNNAQSIQVADDNPAYTYEEGALYNKDKTEIIKVYETDEKFTVNKNVETIRPYAFYKLDGLKEVVFESGGKLKEIKKYTFEKCNELDTLYLSANIEAIRVNNMAVSNITIEEGSRLQYLRDIFDNNISDISFLKNAANLKDLYLGNTKIEDFTVLESLDSLENVYIASCNAPQAYFENMVFTVSFPLGKRVVGGYYSDSIGMGKADKIPFVVKMYKGYYSDGKYVDTKFDFEDENHVIVKEGSQDVTMRTSLLLKQTNAYVTVNARVTVFGFNTDEELVSDDSIEADLLLKNYTTQDNTILEANRNLWKITDLESFEVERVAGDISEYISEKIYIHDGTTWIPSLKESNKDILYVKTDNSLYCEDEKVTDHVKKYDKFYALTETGELKNMKGKTIAENIVDFVSCYRLDLYQEQYRYYVVLKSDGSLYSFMYEEEDNKELIDTNVKAVRQGGNSLRPNDGYGFAMYLKNNGEVYKICNLGYIAPQIEYRKVTEEVNEILSYNIIKKNDGSVFAIEYDDGEFIEKKIFDNSANIEKSIHIYNPGYKYVFCHDSGNVSDLIFIDGADKAYKIDPTGNILSADDDYSKLLSGTYGRVTDRYGIWTSEENLSMGKVKLDNNILYVNNIKIMTNVINAAEQNKNGKLIFSRIDGTIWVMDYNAQGEKATPHKVHTFTGTVYGDITGDGTIDIKDSALLKRALAGWDVDIDESAADIDGDGKLTIKDSAILKRYLAGWNVRLGQ